MNTEIEKDWALLAVDRMDRFQTKLFAGIADDYFEKLIADGWQLRATIEAIRPMFSTLHWPSITMPNARAKFVGGLMGHTKAHYENVCDPRIWRRICEMWFKVLEFTRDYLKEPISDEDVLRPDENPFVDLEPQFNSAMTGVMRYACRQAGSEQIMFYDGYIKALRKGSLTLNATGVGHTTRTTAYQMVAAFGPHLAEKCRTVYDVHRFLEFVLGKQKAGTIKRTESLCKYLGLRFKDPGRPSALSAA